MLYRQSGDMNTQLIDRMRNGNGTVTVKHLLNPDEMLGKGRLFARNAVPPGASIGVHRHEGDSEAYYILSGRGRYTDDGRTFEVQAGDLAVVDDGHLHGIENIGDEPLEFIALILFTGEKK